MDDNSYIVSMDQSTGSQSPDLSSGAKLPPVLANLMGSVGNPKSQTNPLPGTMQEILTSIMVSRFACCAPFMIHGLFCKSKPCQHYSSQLVMETSRSSVFSSIAN